jgi:uncharacterized protein YjiK
VDEKYTFIVKDETGRTIYKIHATPGRALSKLKRIFFGGGNGKRKNCGD